MTAIENFSTMYFCNLAKNGDKIVFVEAICNFTLYAFENMLDISYFYNEGWILVYAENIEFLEFLKELGFKICEEMYEDLEDEMSDNIKEWFVNNKKEICY
jgi:hypothetical protein